ncbi:MAG TPA: CsbD family protein [Bryobacteraceae bacterium]|nr:CsbD family protein [Bryobacteraceae bacterium]
MEDSDKDRVKGKFHEAKGAVKEKAGALTNNPDLQDKGQAEKVGGKVQNKIGQIEKVFGK